MKLKPEQLEAARQKQVGNILTKLSQGGVLSKAEMRVLQGATDSAVEHPPLAAPVETPVAESPEVLANARHEAFAVAMAAGRSAAEAYVDAGYKPDRGHACRLAAKPELLARVEQLKEAARRVVPARGALRPPLLPGSVASLTRARQEGAASDAARVSRTMESMSLSMSMALDEHFPDEDVVRHIDALLHADKSYQQDGMLVTVADHTSRARGVELLLKYKLGNPFNRAEPKGSKVVDLVGFAEKLKKSPAFRLGLKEMIAEAEESEKASPPEAAPPPS